MFQVNDQVKCKMDSPLYLVVGNEIGTVVETSSSDDIQFVSVFFPIYNCTQGLSLSSLFEIA